MARYVDADKFKQQLETAMEKLHLIGGIKGVDVGAVIKALDMQPAADVVPRSEIERLEKENAELLISGTTDILISNYKLFRVRTEHPIFKAIRETVAKEIFDAIDESMIRDHAAMVIRVEKFIELKKKYTEEQNGKDQN